MHVTDWGRDSCLSNSNPADLRVNNGRETPAAAGGSWEMKRGGRGGREAGRLEGGS